MINAPKYLSKIESSRWMMLGLVAIPWLMFGLVLLVSRRWWLEDELEILINRRAMAFAFYGSFFGLLGFYHLQAAGFLPDITLRSRDLLAGMSLLLLLGLGLSKLRYR